MAITHEPARAGPRIGQGRQPRRGRSAATGLDRAEASPKISRVMATRVNEVVTMRDRLRGHGGDADGAKGRATPLGGGQPARVRAGQGRPESVGSLSPSPRLRGRPRTAQIAAARPAADWPSGVRDPLIPQGVVHRLLSSVARRPALDPRQRHSHRPRHRCPMTVAAQLTPARVPNRSYRIGNSWVSNAPRPSARAALSDAPGRRSSAAGP